MAISDWIDKFKSLFTGQDASQNTTPETTPLENISPSDIKPASFAAAPLVTPTPTQTNVNTGAWSALPVPAPIELPQVNLFPEQQTTPEIKPFSGNILFPNATFAPNQSSIDAFNKAVEDKNKEDWFSWWWKNLFDGGQYKIWNTDYLLQGSQKKVEEEKNNTISIFSNDIVSKIKSEFPENKTVEDVYWVWWTSAYTVGSKIDNDEEFVKWMVNFLLTDTTGQARELEKIAMWDVKSSSQLFENIRQQNKINLSDDVLKSIFSRTPAKSQELQTQLSKIDTTYSKINDAARAINPQIFDEFQNTKSTIDSIWNKYNLQRQQNAKDALKKNWLITVWTDGTDIIGGKAMSMLAEYEGDNRRVTQTWSNIVEQGSAIANTAKAQWYKTLWDKIVVSNYETIQRNKTNLDNILLHLSVENPDATKSQLNSLLEKRVSELWFRSQNDYLLMWVKSLDGSDATFAKIMSPEDLLKSQVRVLDEQVRLQQPSSVKNTWAQVNNVLWLTTMPLVWATAEWLENLWVIYGQSRSDLWYTWWLDATKRQEYDYARQTWARVWDVLPETIVSVLSMKYVPVGLNSVGKWMWVVEWIKSGGKAVNLFNNLGNLSKIWVNEAVQNAMFSSFDTWINTRDQAVFDLWWSILWAWFESIPLVKSQLRYGKYKDVIDARIQDNAIYEALTKEKANIIKNNPWISEDAANIQAKAIVNNPTYKLPKSSVSYDEIKRIVDDAKAIEEAKIKLKESATPEQLQRYEAIEKLWFTKEKIRQDMLRKTEITDEDMWNYNRLIETAKNKDVPISDLIKATEFMDTTSKTKVAWLLSDYTINRSTAWFATKLPFWYIDENEFQYTKSVFGKLSPTEKYTIEDISNISRNINDVDKNPLWLQKDILDKEWKDYKYFDKNKDWTYTLNSDWFKKLGIIDQRWNQAVISQTKDSQTFYQALSEITDVWVNPRDIELMQQYNTFDKVKKAVDNLVPCI